MFILSNKKKTNMKPVHRAFDLFSSIGKKINKKILFISELTPDRYRFYGWIPSGILRQAAYQIIKALDMALEILKSQKVDAIIIFEHKPQYSLFIYILCIIKRVPTFFFVHDFQQTFNKSLTHYWGFKLLLYVEWYFQFYPLHIEINDQIIEPSFRFKKSFTLPLPLPREKLSEKKLEKRSTIRIGVVGMLRNDKQILPLIQALLKFKEKRDNIEIIVGTPLWQITEEIKNLSLTILDTSSVEQYNQVLASTDILATAFEKDSFYFRPSGIIADGIAFGCYIVAPNYPVFKAQISNPVVVGQLYNQLCDIDITLDTAIFNIQNEIIDFSSWRDFRSDTKLLNSLGQIILSVLEK